MKKIGFFLLVLSSSYAWGQTASYKKSPTLTNAPSPQSVGISAERLAKLDAMIQKNIDDNIVPGAVAIICRNGKIVHHKAYGMADATQQRASKIDDIFRIASQTKAITATAAMMLWEEGKFSLDDPISKYIPEFKNPFLLDKFSMKDSTFTTKPAGKEITVRHLITHTSGIGYGIIDADDRYKAMYKKVGITDLFTTEDITIEESVKKLAKMPLHHVPGEAYYYSEGLDVLGYLIEIWSGLKLDKFFETRIFKPLGMTDTQFYLNDNKAHKLVAIHTKDKTGKWIKSVETFYDGDYPKKGAKRFFSGGAGLTSTALDYALFLQMYLNKGELNGVRILSRKTIETMMTNQSGDMYGGPTGPKYMGLGFAVVNPRGVAAGGIGSEGTFEWGGYFNSNYFADPKENVIGVILKQTRNIEGDITSGLFRQMLFQTIDD